MLQKALHRAVRLSAAAQVLATAAEGHRTHWQGALWCVRPEHRFVSECPGWSALTTASAVLWIAARAPSALVTILPARCYVADEWKQLAGPLDRGGERRVPPRLAREALLAAPRRYWDRLPWVPRQVFRVNPCGWSGLRSTRAIERIACPKRGRYANPKGIPVLVSSAQC
jgi:hypothetical protein